MRGVASIAAALAFAWVVWGSGTAHGADDVGVGAVAPHVARSVLLVEPFPLYFAPGTASSRNPLGATSMSGLRTAARRAVAADPRLATSDRTLLELILEHNREPQQADLRALAEQNARAGLTSFRQYEMTSAIDELERAAEAYRQTGGAFVAAAELADVHFYLALAWLQVAEQSPGRAAEAEVRARAAFAQLVRLDPTRVPDPDAYPPHILTPWREAWAEHVVDRGSNLVLTLEEARWLARRLDRDVLVRTVVVGDATGLWLRVQAFDRGLDSFVYNEVVPFEANTAEAEVQMAISDVAACLPAVAPPEMHRRPEWSGELLVGYSGGTFLQAPTRALFYAQGLNVEGAAVRGRVLGGYGAVRLLFATRDARGDLVDRLETVQVAAGLRLEHRVRNVRFSGGIGLQLMHNSQIQVSRSFWCRVSEGEPEVFDYERECAEGDVIDRPAAVTGGLDLRTAIGVALGGPVWLVMQSDVGFFVVPFEARVLNVPIGASFSIAYRF